MVKLSECANENILNAETAAAVHTHTHTHTHYVYYTGLNLKI